MIIQGIQEGEVYGADTPLFFSVAATGNEYLLSVILELKIWYGDKVTDKPSTPNYVISRDADSFGLGGTFTEFNVSNFAKDVLRFDTFAGSYALNNAIWLEVAYLVNYQDGITPPQAITGDVTIVCTNGYSLYEQGVNSVLNPVIFPSPEINATIGSSVSITTLASQITGSSSKTITRLTATYSDGTTSAFVLPAVTDTTNDLFQVAEFIVTDVDYIDIVSDVPAYGSMRVIPKSVHKYKPQRVGYLDSNGAISYITFFGNSKEISEYNRNSQRSYSGSSFGANLGNKNYFSTNGSETIILNSDWVCEGFFNAINELLLSKYVFFETEGLVCGKTYPEIVEGDGGICESAQCLSDKLVKFGLSLNELRTEPTYEVTERTAILPKSKKETRKMSVDGLINYQIEFEKAFDKKPTLI